VPFASDKANWSKSAFCWRLAKALFGAVEGTALLEEYVLADLSVFFEGCLIEASEARLALVQLLVF